MKHKLLVLLLSAITCSTELHAAEPNGKYAIVIHGGAGKPPATNNAREKRIAVLQQALNTGTGLLKGGASSLDTVERVVRILEDSPAFNAGKGAVFNAAGNHELDATIMDGRDRSVGAVGGVTTVKNPVSLARRVMTDTRHVLLANQGADQFADEYANDPMIQRVPNHYFSTEHQRQRLERTKKQENQSATDSIGTVGCVALDIHGNLAAATSTGGLNNKKFGRLGDSPIAGAGTFADNASCAVSCTGIGEDFIRNSVAYDVAARMRYRGDGLDKAIRDILEGKQHRVRGGIIAVGRDGLIAARFNTEGMSWAAADSDGRHEVNIAVAKKSRPRADYGEAIVRLRAAILHEVETKELPAFSMALVDNDRTAWAEGFGYQDAEKKVPATEDTVYRVGSVSKLFTDIAVMQLVEAGKLDLDAPVSRYLPEFRPKNRYKIPLTLRQLMSHQSGLVRESPVGNYFDPDEPSLAETVASLNQTSLVYQPETKTKYSNAAVAVVGAILEEQLDVTHPRRVKDAILDPLKMTGSSFTVTTELEPKLATGWMRTYDGRRFQAPTFLLGTGPAGNLYSSVTDLSKFLACLFRDGKTGDGQIMSFETLKLMTTPIEDAAGRPQPFGLGFHVAELDGYKQIGHGGAVYGFSTQLEALPERRLGVAAASSLDGSNGVVRRLADYALRLMIATQDGKPLPTYRTTEPLPAERARELIGTYREVDGDRFARVTEFGGQVFLRRGTFRYRLGAASDNGQILTDDEVGHGQSVSLSDGDTLKIDDVVFKRMADKPPAECPERWRGLIGEYGWDHNTLYILEEAGQLYALIEWFYYYPLKEVDQNTFEFPNYGLYHGEGLTFRRDEHGNATEVVAAEVKFARREVGTKVGETFKIKPVRPIEALRAGALAAAPPAERGDFRASDLVDLTTLDATIELDIRYATTNNFTGAVFYKQPRAFMQRPAAEAVVRAHERLAKRGLGILVHDAYRPWHVTKMFWDATPEDLKAFVANPANGSRHNRGCAVDITLYDLASGNPIQMVAGYDEFSPRSFPLYPGGTSRQRWHRELLRRTMNSEGFSIYEYEWWHFDFRDWTKYRIENVTFGEIEP